MLALAILIKKDPIFYKKLRKYSAHSPEKIPFLGIFKWDQAQALQKVLNFYKKKRYNTS